MLHKAPLAWEKVCAPRSAGGFNVIDMMTWNKAAISKHLWNRCQEKHRMWILWIHNYYIKWVQAWDVYPKQASRLVREIFKAKGTLEEAGMSME